MRRVRDWILGCPLCGMPSLWEEVTGPSKRPNRYPRQHLKFCPRRPR